MQKIEFNKNHRQISAIRSGPESPIVFFFHGGGLGAEKEKMIYLMKDLVAQGVGSISFDAAGVGESDGQFSKTSLATRATDAEFVIRKSVKPGTPIGICAFSMGAAVAIKLVSRLQIKCLFLFCPAIYDARAEKKHFSPAFTEIIRRPSSWKRSSAPKILKQYRGDVVFILPDKDKVIPPGVARLIYKSTSRCRSRRIIRLKNCPHKLHAWLKAHNTDRAKIIGLLAKTLQ